MNALGARMGIYFLNYGSYESDDRVTMHIAATVGQKDVRWLQVRAWHDRSYMAGIPVLTHGLTVKLSLCPSSHSSPAGQIAACLCGHCKCNLLPAQAHPRMIQHLSSIIDCVYIFLLKEEAFSVILKEQYKF